MTDSTLATKLLQRGSDGAASVGIDYVLAGKFPVFAMPGIVVDESIHVPLPITTEVSWTERKG